MLTINLMGEEVWVCTLEEAKRLWGEKKQDRSRIWLESEVDKALLLGPDEIAGIMERKRDPRGYVYKGS